MVIALLALTLTVAGGALAASWPPASLAFQWGLDNNYTILSVKQPGSVKMSDGKVKFYQFPRSTTAAINCIVSGPEGPRLAVPLDPPAPPSGDFRPPGGQAAPDLSARPSASPECLDT